MMEGINSESVPGQTPTPKHWNGLTAEEKIERMRSVIHSITRENRSMREMFYNLSNNFREHKHVDGKICITFGIIHETAKIGSVGLSENQDEVYF